jgi:hypothetical protein
MTWCLKLNNVGMGAYKLLYMKSSPKLKISNKLLPLEFSNSHLFSYKTYVGFGVGDTHASYKVLIWGFHESFDTINFTTSLYTLVTMTIYHPIVHGCIKSLFLVLFDEWLTFAIPSPTTFPLNLGWKMEHFVPTFNGTYHHTFKQHVRVCNMNYE